MLFHVYQYERDRDTFVVTDAEHERDIIARLSAAGDKLAKVGEYPEIGKERLAFNEALAKSAIKDHGYYRFTAKSFAPAGQPPLSMPI